MQHGGTLCVEQPIKCIADFSGFLDTAGLDTKCPGNTCKVRVVGQVNFTVIAIKKDFLPLAYQAKCRVVQQQYLDIDIVGIVLSYYFNK